jgi:hypothetical protein
MKNMAGGNQHSEREYFQRRAAEERAAADTASDPLAQRAHLELANCFDELAQSIGEPSEPLRIRIGGNAPVTFGKS